MFNVIIDAGHGGKDNGSIGINKYKEKDGTLIMAKYVKQFLSPYPEITTYLTRDTDITLEPKDRTNVINSFNGDIVVSIHSNADVITDKTTNIKTMDISAHGTNTYYSIRQNQIGDMSKALATKVQQYVVQYAKTNDRGITCSESEDFEGQDMLYILRDTNEPCVPILVETAFHTNIKDEAKLARDCYKRTFAMGIARGIVEYLGLIWKG